MGVGEIKTNLLGKGRGNTILLSYVGVGEEVNKNYVERVWVITCFTLGGSRDNDIKKLVWG